MAYAQKISKEKENKQVYVAEKEGERILKKIDKEKYNGYQIGDLRKTFSKHQDKTNWKKPVYAIVKDKKEAQELETAIIFFQADQPTIKKISVPVRHREGLVYMEGTAYLVESKGYQG